MFEISFDDPTGTLHLRLAGHWDAATLEAFTAALRHCLGVSNLAGRRFAVLGDSSDFAVQSLAIAEGFDRVMQHHIGSRARAVAVIVGSTLNRLQVKRTVSMANFQVFDDRDAALHWLNAGQDLPTAA